MPDNKSNIYRRLLDALLDKPVKNKIDEKNKQKMVMIDKVRHIIYVQ